MESLPITEAERFDVGPEQVVDLDLATIKATVGEDDGQLTIALGDDLRSSEAWLNVRATPDAWLAVRRLVRQLEALEPEIRAATVGYQHGPLTGPVAWPQR